MAKIALSMPLNGISVSTVRACHYGMALEECVSLSPPTQYRMPEVKG